MPSDPDMTHVLTQCPRCGAPVRGHADWCTLCYTDLRPAPEPEPQPEPAVGEAGLPAVAADPKGKHARRAPLEDEPAPSPAGISKDGLNVDAMFALLAAESTAPLGRLSGRLDTKGAQLTLMVGGLVAVVAVMLVLMFIGGLFV